MAAVMAECEASGQEKAPDPGRGYSTYRDEEPRRLGAYPQTGTPPRLPPRAKAGVHTRVMHPLMFERGGA